MEKMISSNNIDWSIIFQPLAGNTHQKVLNEEFHKDVRRILISTAYVNQDGVESLLDNIKAHSDKIEIFTGVGERNSTTSKQALELLHDAGIKLYVVDTNKSGVIFHPKIFLFEKEQSAKLVIGSANLTHSGLHNNIEVSVNLEIDLECSEQLQKYDSILDSFDKLKSEHSENCYLVKNRAAIEELFKKGRIVDESEKVERTGSSNPKTKNKGKPIGLPFVPKSKKKRKSLGQLPADVNDSFGKRALCYVKKKLPVGDLQLLKSGHGSGVIRLVKSGFKINDKVIDQETYFRKNVFGDLKWAKVNDKEEAIGVFKLSVKGKSCGVFNIKLSHKPSWESGQKNYTTGLHVSPIKKYIQKEEFINKQLKLYKITDAEYSFEISIE